MRMCSMSRLMQSSPPCSALVMTKLEHKENKVQPLRLGRTWAAPTNHGFSGDANAEPRAFEAGRLPSHQLRFSPCGVLLLTEQRNERDRHQLVPGADAACSEWEDPALVPPTRGLSLRTLHAVD